MRQALLVLAILLAATVTGFLLLHRDPSPGLDGPRPDSSSEHAPLEVSQPTTPLSSTPREALEGGRRPIEPPSPDPSAPSGSVVLRVVDREDGSPLEELAIAYGVETLRDLVGVGPDRIGRFPNGEVVLPLAPAPGRVTLRVLVAAPGHVGVALERPVVDLGARADWGTVQLARATPMAVEVLDAGSGATVADARVLALQLGVEGWDEELALRRWRERGDAAHLLAPGFEMVRTDERGRARLTTPSSGAVHLYVDHPELAPHGFPARPVAPEVSLVVGPGGRIAVEVTRAAEPVSGESVRATALDLDPWFARLFPRVSEGTLATDSAGAGSFDRLPPGRFRVSIHVPPRGGERIQVGDGALIDDSVGADGEVAQQVVVGSGRTAEVRFAFEAEYPVTGTVSLGTDPLAGADLVLTPIDTDLERAASKSPEARVQSHAGGAFEFPSVLPGTYRVRVDHPALAIAHDVELVQQPAPTRHEIVLAATRLHGVVRDPDGRGVQGARVTILRAGSTRLISQSVFARRGPGERVLREFALERTNERQTVTDVQGRYELSGLPLLEALTVLVESDLARPTRSEPFRLTRPDEEHALDVEVEPAGAIALSALTKDGVPLGACLFRVTTDEEGDDEAGMATTNDDGVARVTGLASGRYWVSCEWPWAGDPPHEPPPQLVEVEAGQEARVTVRW